MIEGDNKGFHSCGEEIVADSSDVVQFKKGNPTDSVDLISEGLSVIEEDAEIADSLQRGRLTDRYSTEIDKEGRLRRDLVLSSLSCPELIFSHPVLDVRNTVLKPLKGGQGISDVSPLSGISGLSV